MKISAKLNAAASRVINALQNEKVLLILSAAFLAVCCIDLIVFNLLNSKKVYLTPDGMAEAFKISRAIYEHGLLFNGFYPSWENFGLSRAFLIQIPLYLICGDWVVSYALTKIVVSAAVAGLFYLLLKECKIGVAPTLLAISALIMTSWGYMQPFRVNIGYSMFILLFLSFLLLYVNVFINQRRRLLKLKLFIMGAIAIVAGLYGSRMTAVLFLPLFLIEFCVFLANAKDNAATLYDQLKQNRRLLFLSAVLFANLICVALSGAYYKMINGGYLLTLELRTDGIFDHISHAINEYLKQLSIVNTKLTGSSKTLEVLLRLYLFAFIALAGIYAAFGKIGKIASAEATGDKPRERERESKESTKYVCGFFVASIGLSFIICFTVFINSESRYFFLVPYFLCFLIAVLIDKLSTKIYRFLVVAPTVILIALTFANKELPLYKSEYGSYGEKSYKLAQFLSDSQTDIVYTTQNFSGIHAVELLTNGKVRSSRFNYLWKPDMKYGFMPLTWVDNSHNYNRDFTAKYNKIAVVMTEQEEKDFLSVAPWQDKEALKTAVKAPFEFNDINVYLFDFNPIVEFKTPLFKGDESSYYFSDRYADKSGGYKDYIIDWKNGILDVLSNATITSPKLKARKGEYAFTIDYEYIDFQKPAVLIVKTSSRTIFHQELPPQETQIISYAKLQKTYSDLQIILVNDGESKIKLNAARVRKIK
ncbi:MAG: hypothetical protein LBI57_00600 [Helicobacteraceae bacterium]|nr:hypothetical protein [Helicobacteraceae bacterium]